MELQDVRRIAIVTCPCYGGFVTHFGLLLTDRWGGEVFIERSFTARVVRYCDRQQFADGAVISEKVATTNPWQISAIYSRAMSQIGQPYDLIANNCENFAEWAFHGKHVVSKQVVGGGVIALLLSYAGYQAYQRK